VPAYVAVLSNRPLDAIASSPIRQKLGIGLRNLTITQRAGISKVVAVPDDSFRTALIDIKRDHGLYREEDNAVTFLSPGLFRAAIRLPAVSPIGSYDIEINLFADGASLTQTNSALEVVKVGVEQFIASAAREHGLLYGLATTFMALATGWFAAMIFRRD
jgi:uncharacterized protein (TIGR02186 family)